MGNVMVAAAPRFHGILLLEIVYVKWKLNTNQEKQIMCDVLNYVCFFHV